MGIEKGFRDLSINQLEDIFQTAEQIIEGLDEYAVGELFSGYEKDLDTILENILIETKNSLYSPTAPVQTSSFGYLEKLTDNFEEQLRVRSFNYFCMSVLPEFDINIHHIEWGNIIQFYKWLCVIAARDHSKSFTFSFAYPLWKLYRYSRNNLILPYKENYLNKKGMIITNESNLASDFLKQIKSEIENNPILREKLYPDKVDTWGATELVCRNGASLKAKGAGSALRGQHPHWIVVDDYLDDSALYSLEQREKQINRFHSVIMNMIVPGGQVCVVGTPYHEGDLYGNLKTADGWKVLEYPAIDPFGNVLWADRYNLDALIAKKKSQGSIIFSREILVKPITADSSIFPYSILENSFKGMDRYNLVENIQSFPRKFKKVVVGADFAISAKIGADYTVYTVIGVDERNRFWLLYQWRKRGATYNEQVNQMKRVKAAFKPNVIYAESNQFQKVLIDMMNDHNLNVIPHHTGIDKYDLRTGLPALAALFETNRILFPRGDDKSKTITDIICNEAAGVTWTNDGKLENTTDHDDAVMSLWLAIKGAHYVSGDVSLDFV